MFDEQFALIPAAPPRSVDLLPGLRLAAVVSRRTLLLPIVFVTLFSLFPMLVAQSDPTMRLAMGPSRSVPARVLAVAEVSSGQRAGSHRITYVFSTQDGRQFRGAGVVRQDSAYYSIQPGDTIEVKYLSHDPSVNIINSVDSNNGPPVFLFFFFPVFALLVFTALFLPQLREMTRARRLFRTGHIAIGKVVFVKKTAGFTWPGWPGNAGAEVYVTYHSGTGEQTESRAWCANDWLLQQLVPGISVHIAYRGDTTARVALLEAFLR
jgi:hypothetical protein